MILKKKLGAKDVPKYLQKFYGVIDDKDPVELPFISYILADKSELEPARKHGWKDDEDLFLVHPNAPAVFYLNWSFVFVNTKVFTQVASDMNKNKVYNTNSPDSPEWINFWRRENSRRRKGAIGNCRLNYSDMEAYLNASDADKPKYLKPVRITGRHYGYLNYNKIKAYPNEEEAADAKRRGILEKGKIRKFPVFSDGDFWYFHIKEFGRRNNLDRVSAKARRKGFTYKEAWDTADQLNLFPDVSIIHAAYNIDYLTKDDALTNFTLNALQYLEDNTYWQRGIGSRVITELELGYKESKTGHTIKGWKSSLISCATMRNSSFGVGKSPLATKYEESGVFNNLIETLLVNEASLREGGESVGDKDIFGTGGTKDANWANFKSIYYSPRSHNCMQFANVWDDNSIDKEAGFFFPNVLFYNPCVDEDGNSQVIDAYYNDIAKKRQAALDLKPSDFILFLGQSANKPSEAFYTTVDNMFTSDTLNNQLMIMSIKNSELQYQDGQIGITDNKTVQFKSNLILKAEGLQIHGYIEDVHPHTGKDNKGCLRIFYPPFKNSLGEVPKDLYFITYDTYGKDKDSKDVNDKNSLACIDVWMYPNKVCSYTAYKVATFVGRRDTQRDCDVIAYCMSVMYNAKVCPETDRGTCIQTFKELHAYNRLMDDPTIVYDDKSQRTASKGILIGTTTKKVDGLFALKEFIYTLVSKNNVDETNSVIQQVLHFIPDYWLLYEIANYSESSNLDRLSSAIIAAFIYRTRSISSKPSNASIKKRHMDNVLSNYGIG